MTSKKALVAEKIEPLMAKVQEVCVENNLVMISLIDAGINDNGNDDILATVVLHKDSNASDEFKGLVSLMYRIAEGI